MVGAYKNKCEHVGCLKIAPFGEKSTKTRVLCSPHARDGTVKKDAFWGKFCLKHVRRLAWFL